MVAARFVAEEVHRREVHRTGSSSHRKLIAQEARRTGGLSQRKFTAQEAHRTGSSSHRKLIAKEAHRKGGLSHRRFVARGRLSCREGIVADEVCRKGRRKGPEDFTTISPCYPSCYEDFAEMRPHVELPRNLGLFVTPTHHNRVYSIIGILPDRGLHV
jgi:hypothetical protein